MDLRTKLILAFVAVSLASMLLLGSFAYAAAAGLLKEISHRQLDALAESKQDDLEQLIEGWRDRVRLLRSRTQLRLSLAELNAGTGDDPLTRIQRILADAQQSTSMVRRLEIFALDGRPLASAGFAERRARFVAPGDADAVSYSGVEVVGDELAEIAFHTQLTLDERALGVLEVVFDARELGRVTDDYTGLGETGETFVVFEVAPGEVRAPTAFRHRVPGSGGGPLRVPGTAAVRAALDGDERVFEGTAIDYRGEEVWAATRHLSDVGWGLVVKIDVAEESQRVHELRTLLRDVGLSLSAFAILGGVMLGLYMARPIHDLAELVQRITDGETHLRARAEGDDEVAYLARKLNEMMDALEKQRRRDDES